MTRGRATSCLLATVASLAWAATAAATLPACTQALGSPSVVAGPLQVLGLQPAAVDVALLPGHAYLIEVEEHDNDARIEILDASGRRIARADHPERRTGTRRALIASADPRAVTVRVTGKEHANVAGTATVRAFDLAALGARPDCLAIIRALSQADSDFAVAEDIVRGQAPSASANAREAYLRSAQGYLAAEQALALADDPALRGETALALAGLEYLDLQDWSQAATWAQSAAAWLGREDPYRHARAEALLAAAWIEIGSTAAAGSGVPGQGRPPSDLLVRARRVAQALDRFHLKRGERYDAGLQETNVALTYLYEGRYGDCVTASVAAGELFEGLRETLRRAQAWQNRALCLWGLGRLPEALPWLKRALKDIDPQPYPRIYLASINNTALAEYALGHFDESLDLFDRALKVAQEVQSPRDEAQCLYGIGVNYYAIGDKDRARGFLERALAIRSAALDGRGRMATLRALATIDAEQGRIEAALAADDEALGLAIAPAAIARIRIQRAAHVASAGRLEEAKAGLDQSLTAGARLDPRIEAEARLQRAVVLRELGRSREALADLSLARPRLHALGTVTEEFQANLETARTRRQLGQPRAALAAVERALGESGAVRLQTANPEFRLQLQAPLRAAYDLKLELLRGRYERAQAAGREDEARALAVAAFVTADGSRAHSFADVAAQQYSALVRRELAPEFRRREALYRELAARRFALDARLDKAGSEDRRAQHLAADIAELQREVDAVNTSIGRRTQAEGALSRAEHRRADLPALPADTALVSYWLGSESAYAWVVSPAELRWTRLAPPSEISARAVGLHRSLVRLVDVPAGERLENARALYELILRPIESSLSAWHQWVLIPDGALDYVPFAALRTGSPERFVVAQHDLVLTPAAWLLDTGSLGARHDEDRGLLLVADPVYQPDDPRLAAVLKLTRAPITPSHQPPEVQAPRYPRLPFTAREAAQILREFPPGSVDLLLGLDATRARVLARDLSRYRFIHLATHGIVDAGVPQLSALVLGSYDERGNAVEGEIRVADLAVQTLNADVVVFSACDTALGAQFVSEGLVGLRSITLARGARAVVASLWPIADEMGAKLMTEFYRGLLRDSLSPPEALGAAMRSVLSGDGSSDPALWAAYQVSAVAIGSGTLTRRAIDHAGGS